MKTYTSNKIILFSVLFVLFALFCGAMVSIPFVIRWENKEDVKGSITVIENPVPVKFTVSAMANEHEVILLDSANNVYILTVKNAYDSSFEKGGVLYFGKGRVRK